MLMRPMIPLQGGGQGRVHGDRVRGPVHSIHSHLGSSQPCLVAPERGGTQVFNRSARRLHACMVCMCDGRAGCVRPPAAGRHV